MGFKIRDIVARDIPQLAPIFADAYKPEKTGEHWTVEAAQEVVEYWFKRSPDDLKILAEGQDGRILGAFFVDVKPWWDGARMVDGEFFVHSDAQGVGVGKALMAEILKRAETNHKAVNFETITFEPDSEHPLRWYLKMGFKKEESLVVINGNIKILRNNLG